MRLDPLELRSDSLEKMFQLLFVLVAELYLIQNEVLELIQLGGFFLYLLLVHFFVDFRLGLLFHVVRKLHDIFVTWSEVFPFALPHIHRLALFYEFHYQFFLILNHALAFPSDL